MAIDIQQSLNNLTVSAKIAELLDKYKVENKKKEIITQILASFLQGQIEEFDVAGELEEKAGIDFTVATDLAYDLTTEVLPSLPPELQKAGVNKPLATEQGITLPQIVEAIKKEAGLKLSDLVEKRFENIVFNWFRDIRDDSETVESLKRSPKVGGLGLEQKEAVDLINILKNKEAEYAEQGISLLDLITKELTKESALFSKKAEVKEEEIDVTAQPSKLAVAKEKPTGTDITIEQILKNKNFPAASPAPQEEIKKNWPEMEKKTAPPAPVSPLLKEIEAKEEFLESKEELEPPEVKPEIKQPPAPVVPPPAPVNPAPAAPAAPAELPAKPGWPTMKQPLIKKVDAAAGFRPKVEDVKFTAQLYGPLEELASFKIEDFRRLSKDPKEAARKIIGKLELLEDESLTKKAEGIKALKNSPLYKVYADIMNQAIRETKTFEQVVAGKKTLTLEEFKAVMELNKSLKY